MNNIIQGSGSCVDSIALLPFLAQMHVCLLPRAFLCYTRSWIWNYALDRNWCWFYLKVSLTKLFFAFFQNRFVKGPQFTNRINYGCSGGSPQYDVILNWALLSGIFKFEYLLHVKVWFVRRGNPIQVWARIERKNWQYLSIRAFPLGESHFWMTTAFLHGAASRNRPIMDHYSTT